MLSPHLDAVSADLSGLKEAEGGTIFLQVWTQGGLESVSIDVEIASPPSVTLPAGFRPSTLSFHDPNLANRIVQAAGTELIFMGRAVVAPLQVLSPRAQADAAWRAAYQKGVAREREKQRPVATPAGFDFWPGYRPPTAVQGAGPQ